MTRLLTLLLCLICIGGNTANCCEDMPPPNFPEYSSLFDQIDHDLTLEEIADFVFNFKSTIEYEYGIVLDLEDACNHLILLFDYLNLDDEICELFSIICDFLLQDTENNFTSMCDTTPSIYLCKNKNKKKKDKGDKEEKEIELPADVAIGFCETLGGALLWIVPFPASKQLGSFLIGDGVRRMLN